MKKGDAKATHEYFMKIALRQAEDALALGEFPVGCVIVYDGEVIAAGERRNSNAELCEMDHAEIVALRNLQQVHPNLDLRRAILYSTMEPCLMCYSTMLVNSLHRIVYAYEDAMGGGTSLPLQLLTPLYASMQVEIVRDILRPQSLKLFQEFFGDESNDYLKNSLLARYTLEQIVVTK